MVSVVHRNQTGFDSLMRGRGDAQRSYVIEKLEGMGTTVSDPWYLQLANITLLGVILEQVPHEYRETVQEAQRQFFEELRGEMDALENVKASSVEVKIASAVDRLLAERLSESEPSSSTTTATSVSPPTPTDSAAASVKTAAAAPPPESVAVSVKEERPVKAKAIRPFHRRMRFVLPVVVALSMGVGSVLTSFFMPKSYIHMGVKLAPEDSALLNWAKSAEGELAYNLISWNDTRLTTRSCEQQAQTQETRLALDNLIVTTGICTIFVQDPRTVDVVRGEE